MMPEAMAQADLIRMAVFLAIFAAMASWEAVAPLRRSGLPRLVRWSNNLAMVAVGNLLLKLVFPLTAVSFAALAQARGWGLLGQVNWPGWLELALAFVILDLAIYAQHRLFHSLPLLWRLHRVHHADTMIDVTTALRFHPLEIALSMGIKLAVITLAGASAEAVLLFEIVLNGAAMFNHANVSLPAWLERPLRWAIVTPDMHRIHHSTLADETNSNYGFNLSCWDRLFVSYTARPSRPPETMPIGLDQFRDPRDAWLDRLLLQPFAPSQPSPEG